MLPQIHLHQAILMFYQTAILVVVNKTCGFHIHGASATYPLLYWRFPGDL